MKSRIQQYGIIAALALIAYLLSLYFIDKELLTRAPLAYWSPFIIFFVVMYKAASDDCTEKGINRDFREILRTPFAVFALANLAFWLTLYALHLADPELSRLELGKQLAYLTKQLSEGLGDPQAMNQVNQQIQDIKKEMLQPGRQPLGPYIFYLAIWNILGFGLSALIAVLQRSRA